MIDNNLLVLMPYSTYIQGYKYPAKISPNLHNQPLLGPIPTNPAQPLFGARHTGSDAVFALASKYHKDFYKWFVGSLRQSGFNGDIVLAVSTPDKMKPVRIIQVYYLLIHYLYSIILIILVIFSIYMYIQGVAEYLIKKGVIAYGFDVECEGKGKTSIYL